MTAIKTVLFAALALTSSTAFGANGGVAAAPDSTYASAFSTYRPFVDQPVASWQGSNDVVRQVGGWLADARESQGTGGETPTGEASTPAMKPHAGHAAPAGNIQSPPKPPASSSH